MAVLLPNAQLTARVKSHPWTRDAHGTPVVGSATVDERGPYPGAAHEQADLSWKLRVDVRCWPMELGDEVTDGARTWIVTGRTLAQVPGYSDVDHIAVTATLDPPRVP